MGSKGQYGNYVSISFYLIGFHKKGKQVFFKQDLVEKDYIIINVYSDFLCLCTVLWDFMFLL